MSRLDRYILPSQDKARIDLVPTRSIDFIGRMERAYRHHVCIIHLLLITPVHGEAVIRVTVADVCPDEHGLAIARIVDGAGAAFAHWVCHRIELSIPWLPYGA